MELEQMPHPMQTLDHRLSSPLGVRVMADTNANVLVSLVS